MADTFNFLAQVRISLSTTPPSNQLTSFYTLNGQRSRAQAGGRAEGEEKTEEGRGKTRERDIAHSAYQSGELHQLLSQAVQDFRTARV